MPTSFILKKHLQISPAQLFHAWLNSEEHTAMTGGEAICSNQVGGQFSAWDGYISGSNISLVLNEEIIQSWRTTEFEESDQDSELIIKLTEENDGCLLTLIHRNIPEGQSDYKQGWIDHYFTPMKEYFHSRNHGS
ncbi:MAG: SRPBCC domain-containing protein [Cyclobacteriaceae bacterium]